MNEILSDFSKFKELDITPRKEINSLLQEEDRFSNFLKKEKMSTMISYIKSFIQEVYNLVCMVCPVP